MDSHILPKIDTSLEKSTLISSIIIGSVVAAASVLVRHGAEHTWTAAFNEAPPSKQKDDEIDIRDAILWSAAIGVVTGLTRLCVRRMIRRKAYKVTDHEELK